jgi:hypothetical protein
MMKVLQTNSEQNQTVFLFMNKSFLCMWFKVLTVVSIEITVFWDVMPCISAGTNVSEETVTSIFSILKMEWTDSSKNTDADKLTTGGEYLHQNFPET